MYSSLSNIWLQAHGDVGTPPSTPPAGEYAGSSVEIFAQASAGRVLFTGNGETPVGTLVQFELQSLKRASRKPSKNGYRVVGFGALTAEGDYEFEVPVAPGVYAARYAFVEASSGRRTGFAEIKVTGLALDVAAGGGEKANPTPAPPQREGGSTRKKAA